MELKDIENFISRILIFCIIDNHGYVMIKVPNIGVKNKIHLILSARYLFYLIQILNNQNLSIRESVENKELQKMLRQSLKIITTRISDLRVNRYIKDVSKSVYEVKPDSIEILIAKLENESNGN